MNYMLLKVHAILENVLVVVLQVVLEKLLAVAKGQLSRQGGHTRLGFEGGQMPLFRTMPKRGFKNVNRKEYAIINLDDLNKFEDGNEVTVASLKEKGLVKKELSGVKLLAKGELKVKLNVKINKVSAAAKKAVEDAGGSVEVI